MPEWKKARLADLIEIKHGFAFQGEFFSPNASDNILMTPGNFAIGGGFQWGKCKYYTGPVPTEYVLRPDDLIVTMTDLSKEADTLGYAALVPTSAERLLHNQRIGKVVRRSEDVDLKFLHWLMRSRDYRNEVLASSTGSTVKHTSPTKILAFSFLLPSKFEQSAIACILDVLDYKIDLNRRMKETLEAMAQAIFKDWFVDFGPTRTKMGGRSSYLAPQIWAMFPDQLDAKGKPENWSSESVLAQANWINGAAYKNMHFVEPTEGLPVVKIAELKNGITSKTKFTNTDLGDRYRIKDGEILFSWSGNPDTSIDTYIWTGGPAWLNQHIFAVRENGHRKPSFVYAMLKWLNPTFAELARNKQTTGLGHVTKEDLGRLQVVAPSSSIELEFDRIVGPIFARLRAALFEIQTLTSTRDVLLPKLMSGEIRVKDAEKTVEAVA